MPQAESQDPEIKKHVNSLGENLKTLRLRLRRCVSSRPILSLAALWLFPELRLSSSHGSHTQTEGQEPSRFPLSKGWGWLLGIYM